jgi:DNA transposition AAA+ family ATPase
MDLKQRSKEYIMQNKISQANFGKRIGVSESTISRWLNGTYPNSEGTIELKVVELLDKQERRAEVLSNNEIEFVETTVSKKVLSTLEYCRIQKSIGCIYGDAGVGKTRTIKEWINNKTDIIYISATIAFSSPKSFLKRLARELRSCESGQLDGIYTDVLAKLEGRDKTIVIDEAQHLTLKTLDLIRSLNDDTGTAIILVGNDVVYSKLLGKQQAEFAQLFSRISMKIHVLTDNFKLNDMEKVFTQNLEKNANSYMLKIAKSKYGLRGAINVFINSTNNDDVTEEGLKAVSQAMGIMV